MKIVVMGAGSIGSLFGGFLSKKYNTTLIGRKPHVDAINLNGLKISGKTNCVFYPKAFDSIAKINFKPDLIIITVKAYQTENAIKDTLQIIGSNTSIVSIQNGLGNIEKIEKFISNKEKIFAGITSHGVTFSEPGKIYHAGTGDTIIGGYKAEKIAKIFKSVGIKTKVSKNIEKDIWTKAIINAGINPITAITGLNNGYILKIPGLSKILELTCKEGIEVANAYGIKLKDEIIEKAKEVVKLTAENKSSMLQDIINGKKTEIENINGMLVSLGEKKNIATPINATLTALVKGIEATITSS
ncbi:MAG: 2-dehydropantoate 2-reductase [Candidatus Thermoplasmatota archaeon]